MRLPIGACACKPEATIGIIVDIQRLFMIPFIAECAAFECSSRSNWERGERCISPEAHVAVNFGNLDGVGVAHPTDGAH